MSNSSRAIKDLQEAWAQQVPRDNRWAAYSAELAGDVFLRALSERTIADFVRSDSSELRGSARRPAKMPALGSSSALAVNFFDAWRDSGKAALQRGRGLSTIPRDRSITCGCRERHAFTCRTHRFAA